MARARTPVPAAVPLAPALGLMLAQGDTVRTVCGRVTTPFPKVDVSTHRKTINALKAGTAWLMGNALAIAEARGDTFNAATFRSTQVRPSQADKDGAESYLFDTDTVIATPRA